MALAVALLASAAVFYPSGVRAAEPLGPIAFTRGPDPSPNGYAMNADGTGVTQIGTSAQAPSWSPDGSRIAFARPGAGIMVSNTDGTGVTQVTPASQCAGGDGYPAWSPGGQRIAFWNPFCRGGNFVMNVDGSGMVNVSHVRFCELGPPAWSPDGTMIVFACNGNIYVSNADGTGDAVQIASDVAGFRVSWSPDGSMMAFDAHAGIWTMTALGSGITQITSSGDSPDWSADGTHLVYTDDEDVYLVAASGGASTRLTTDPATERWPSWRRGGGSVSLVESILLLVKDMLS